MQINKNILLTGAGFTANFGGLLAREMWSKILNNPKTESIPAVKATLKDNFNFESVYAATRGQDRVNLLEIIIESFSSMDNALKSYASSSFRQFGVDVGGVSRFLASFAGRGGDTGFHFTLNQDLFLERQVHITPLGLPAYQYRDYHDRIQSTQLDSSYHLLLPDESFLNDFQSKHLDAAGDLRYVKLHGSLGWMANDGNKQMILGTNKWEDINKVPLLKWYFGLFKEAIVRPDVKLFVLGYSFNDQHVNDCIVEAIDRHKIKLFVISPEDPQLLKERLFGNPHPGQSYASYSVSDSGQKIWDAISGYFPYRLRDIFPADQSLTHIASDLKRALGTSTFL